MLFPIRLLRALREDLSPASVRLWGSNGVPCRALCVEGVRRRWEQSGLAVAIVMAAGIGLRAYFRICCQTRQVLTLYVWQHLNGSAQERTSLWQLAFLAVWYVVRMRRALLMSFDERHARAVGVHVGLTNFGFIIAVALVVAVAARTVGSLIVSSMMVVPVACALQLSRSWKQCCFISSAISAYVFKRAHNFL